MAVVATEDDIQQLHGTTVLQAPALSLPRHRAVRETLQDTSALPKELAGLTTQYQPPTYLLGDHKAVANLAFHPSNSMLASCARRSNVQLWCLAPFHQQPAAAQPLRRQLLQPITNTTSLDFHPHGQVLVAASLDKKVRLWNVESGACLHTVVDDNGLFNAVVAPGDGATFTTAGGHPNVCVYDTNTGAHMNTMVHGDEIYSLAYGRHARSLATGSFNGKVQLWDVDQARTVQQLREHTGWVWSLCFSPTDEYLLVSSASDRTIRLWDTRTGCSLRTLQGHKNYIFKTVFHPNGQQLISSSNDNSIRSWDVQTGQQLQQLSMPNSAPIAISPDGNLIAVGKDDAVHLTPFSNLGVPLV